MMKSLMNFITLIILIIAISKNIVASLSHNNSNFDLSLRIVGGSKAKDAQFPYVAGVELKHKSGDLIDCTGSLISHTSVLTAAHCLRKDFHDLAIIKLPFRVNTTDHIKLIRIPSSDKRTYAERLGTTMGWGKTSITKQDVRDLTTLRYSTNTILTNADCRKIAVKHVIEDTYICLSGAGGKSTCHGDSGAPLVVKDVQVGVLAFGSSKCRPGHYSVFIRLSKYIQWLRDNS